MRVTDAAMGFVPFIGAWAPSIRDLFLGDEKVTNSKIMSAISTGIDLVSVADKLITFGAPAGEMALKGISKMAGWVSIAFNSYGVIKELVTPVPKIDFLIDRHGFLDYIEDKEFLLAMIPFVREEVDKMVQSGDIVMKDDFWGYNSEKVDELYRVIRAAEREWMLAKRQQEQEKIE